MKKKATILLLISALLMLSQVKAQEIKLSGKVKGNDSLIGGATVTLRSSHDSVLVKGTATNDSGIYELNNLDTGSYILNISYLGYLPYVKEIRITENSKLVMDNVVLSKDKSNYLEAVKVVSHKPFITRSVDKMIINIEGSVYSSGENALRLFNVIPGVRVDPLSGIQFRESQGVTVYVDNRKIQLSGQQLLNYLRSIPSESIKSYEVQAVPGAAYDAQNAGTIINITLKNNYKYGLSGSIGSSYKYTRYNEFDENAAVNYRVGKLTLQVNYYWYRGRQFSDDNQVQQFRTSNLFNLQNNAWTSDVKFHSGKFGFDYRLDDNQTVGANYDYSIIDFQSNNNALSAFTSNSVDKQSDSTTYTLNVGQNKWGNRLANIFYRNKLDSAGSKLDIGYSYIGYHNRVTNAIDNRYEDASKNELHSPDSLFIDNPLNIDIHAANIDLEKIFQKKLTLSAGGKYTYSKTNNAVAYQEGLTGTSSVYDLKSNQFLYNETIAALYGSVSKGWDKWSAKFGLRAENYKYTGNSVTTGEKIGRNRWDFFPSLFLQRKLNEKNTLTLSSGRRITRPDYRQLNPFVDVSNPYYIERGNPFLLPYFTNSIELEYLLKNKYSLTIGYQNTLKAINTVYKHEGAVIISTDENINNNRNVFLSLNIPVKITKWWELSSSLTARYTTIEIKEQPVRKISKLSQDVSVSNRINFLKGYFLEISGIYSRNSFIGIYDFEPQGRIDINIKKSFFKDKLTALLSLGDPFNLYKIGWNVNEIVFTRQIRRRLATRYISVGLTYNFSSGKKQTDRENVEAAGSDARGRL